jgi:hypothetical protein
MNGIGYEAIRTIGLTRRGKWNFGGVRNKAETRQWRDEGNRK